MELIIKSGEYQIIGATVEELKGYLALEITKNGEVIFGGKANSNGLYKLIDRLIDSEGIEDLFGCK